MCEPTTIAIAATAVAVAGLGVSYQSGQNAIAASKAAQQQAAQSQNSAFMARMAAQQAQTQGEAAVNAESARKFTENQAQTQKAQMDAMDARAAQIADTNRQIARNSDTADQAVTQAVQATSGDNLAGAQTDQYNTQTALNQPVQDNIQASNPLGASSTGLVKEATDRGNLAAAKYEKNYADTLAQLSSYNAPVQLTANTARTLGTNLMPAGAADTLIRTSAPALLAPSSTAYANAGAYGSAYNQARELNTKAGLTLADIQAQNAVDLANLRQSDDAAVIQGNLNLSQAQAAQLAGIGSGLTALGGAGLSYAGSQGAFAKAGSGGTPSTNTILNAPYTTSGPVTWKIS